ncbi:hypothetical protein [Limosilactobacillus reuteri]|uniref:Antitoxin n=1 Tax=Limosilactobacillus reuteri TaxID=1598 RepID=A0AB36AHE4_LIMRT|nr:hypothetical protein [Limosilactobacillus reuteri]MCH5358024.1 hypothetical protein [Limosilactobacillus reuteri]MRG84654.1 hypothetical protein [Limosilactobacillus reuteri]
MMSDPNFEWEQLINVNYNNFFKCFEKANKLSEKKELPISVMKSNRQVGVFYSSKAYNKFLKQVAELKREILVLKTSK